MVEDPRERYDDLLLDGEEWDLDAETFEDHAAEEAYRSGWVAGALTFDDEGRVLLAYDADDGEWLAPGGTLEPGETLTEGLRREIREETGVEVDPVRPHMVDEWTIRNGDRSSSFRFVLYEAEARTTDVGEDLGVDDEAITDADWFEALPDDLFERERTERVLRRCERW